MPTKCILQIPTPIAIGAHSTPPRAGRRGRSDAPPYPGDVRREYRDGDRCHHQQRLVVCRHHHACPRQTLNNAIPVEIAYRLKWPTRAPFLPRTRLSTRRSMTRVVGVRICASKPQRLLTLPSALYRDEQEDDPVQCRGRLRERAEGTEQRIHREARRHGDARRAGAWPSRSRATRRRRRRASLCLCGSVWNQRRRIR